MASRKLLVTGATGKQGGALIDALLGNKSSNFSIYGLTRNPKSSASQKLAARHVNMIEGDPVNPSPIFEKIGKGVWGVFSVTVPGKTEEEQAKRLIDAAIENDVQHFVFTSVDRGGPVKSDSDPTQIPHFISKFNVEKYLQDKAASSPQKMTWTILRPVAFYDNLTPDFIGKTFAQMIKQMNGVKLDFISTKDIGKVAARVFQEPEKYSGKAITLAGDKLNFDEINTIFKEEVGTDIPLAPGFLASTFKWMIADLGKMFEWFGQGGYGSDITRIREEDFDLVDFRTWLRNSRRALFYNPPPDNEDTITALDQSSSTYSGVLNYRGRRLTSATFTITAAMNPAITAELDKIDDGIAFRASTNHTHHTWARTFYSVPELYIRPQSVAEVEKAITLARRCRRRITTVGCGHSPSDLTCSSSWMINLDDFNKIISVDEKTGVVVMQAGIRLYQLGEELDKHGLAVPNLGSINQQSIAGAISTGTHGSTLYHSILSSSVISLRITLSNSHTIQCSPTQNLPLFRAALLSLGALGIVTEITFQAVPAFSLHWKQAIYQDKHIFDTWPTDLWKQAEFVRVWWFPYTRRAAIWRASKTEQDPRTLPFKLSYYDAALGYHVYHNLLYLAQYVPRILPWVEWFVFGMQYGFGSGPKTTIQAIQPSRKALLMNCLYSQYVNEWAIPLRLGPIALRRLSSWLNQLTPSDPDYVAHGIPYSATGLWVHAPVEVRISDTSKTRDLSYSIDSGAGRDRPRPYLDVTREDEPTLFLNATLYRPYNLDPPCRARYYQGFEYLMKDLGGKPHWAKNFEVSGPELEEIFGDRLEEFNRVRNDADPEGMFVGSWHRRYILGDQPSFALEETELKREKVVSGGVKIFGVMAAEEKELGQDGKDEKSKEGGFSRPTSSQSSFDLLHGGEAVESQVIIPHSQLDE